MQFRQVLKLNPDFEKQNETRNDPAGKK